MTPFPARDRAALRDGCKIASRRAGVKARVTSESGWFV